MLPVLAVVWLATGVLAGCTTTPPPEPSPVSTGSGSTTGDPTGGPSEGGGAAQTPLPVFDETSVAGSLVEAFPAEVVPVPPGAEILASSATDADGAGLRHVTLNLSSPASVQEILDFYSQSMTSAGFAALPGSVPGGLSGQVAFNRAIPDGATETLSVGVLDAGELRLVTVSGQVVPLA
jgi:hypothetical protein